MNENSFQKYMNRLCLFRLEDEELHYGMSLFFKGLIRNSLIFEVEYFKRCILKCKKFSEIKYCCTKVHLK